MVRSSILRSYQRQRFLTSKLAGTTYLLNEMQSTSRLKLIVVILLAVLAVTFLGAKTFRKTKDATVPVVFEVNPPNPAPNSLVSITVELDGPTPTGEVVSIGSTDTGAFTDLPPQIIVPAGASGATFTATTSPVYTRWAVLAATANGGTALAVQAP